MAKSKSTTIPNEEKSALLQKLKMRFEKNMHRHKDVKWETIEKKLDANPSLLEILYKMEETEGEPDVVALSDKKTEFYYCDCSPESPKGRRSLCYDEDALNSRKEHKPKSSAMQMATEIGITLFDEELYRRFQAFGPFDQKTSSWILTPSEQRDLGGALFGDYRFGRVFIYHNGAESYYGSRGFRGYVKL